MALAALDPEGRYALKTARDDELIPRARNRRRSRVMHAKYAAGHNPKALCSS
jgi:hypothetical protein